MCIIAAIEHCKSGVWDLEGQQTHPLYRESNWFSTQLKRRTKAASGTAHVVDSDYPH